MILITSAAYVTSELISEFGKLPPVFLPLQNKRLFWHQRKLLKDEKIVLSLPEGFVISDPDREMLKKFNYELIFVPEGLSLGASISFIISNLKIDEQGFKILHGDTLFKTLPDELDLYLVGSTVDNYTWTDAESSKSHKVVYAGYFSFSDFSKFKKLLNRNNKDFISTIKEYQNEYKVKNVMAEGWMDFGHSNTYYRSKMKFTTQRAFNDLIINEYSVKKLSANKVKILAEANWYTSIPAKLKRYTPMLIETGNEGDKAFYEIEYFYLSSLSELYVFGKNELFAWEKIFDSCSQFLSECNNIKANPEIIANDKSQLLYQTKTLERLSEYCEKANIDLERTWNFNGIEVPSLLEIIKDINQSLPKPLDSFLSVIHGDFCFSNILFDFKTQNIKVIDPRGIDFDGNESIYGDIRYDVAKLAHSVLGLYDFIISGYYTFKSPAPYKVELSIVTSEVIQRIQESFIDRRFFGYSLNDLSTYPIMIHLFLSMLPLHNDNPERQKVMLANALRLYVEFKKQIK